MTAAVKIKITAETNSEIDALPTNQRRHTEQQAMLLILEDDFGATLDSASDGAQRISALFEMHRATQMCKLYY